MVGATSMPLFPQTEFSSIELSVPTSSSLCPKRFPSVASGMTASLQPKSPLLYPRVLSARPPISWDPWLPLLPILRSLSTPIFCLSLF